MKKVALVISHSGSGSSALCHILDNTKRVQWCRTNLTYHHPEDLEALTSLSHKTNDISAVWLDDVLYNFQFSGKCLYNMCRFIYVIRPPKPTLGVLVKQPADNLYMTRYYTYRLRRMYEMAKKTGGLLLTWDDLITGKSFDLLREYLCVREELRIDPAFFPENKANPVMAANFVQEAQVAYERYFYRFNNMPLLRRT